jgi:hypothetical protein
MSEINNDNLVNIIVQCPHCNNYILIEKLNCKIFRHGILKKNGIQINPHASKNVCDSYVNNNEIYGCGKPFLLIEENNTYIAKICDYI